MSYSYSQTSKQTLRFEKNVYDYKEMDTTRIDTLIYSVQWNFRDSFISKSDSLNLSRILLNLCLQNNKSIKVVYWDFELDEYSEWLFKRRGEELFKFIKKYNCFEWIDMTVYYEIIDTNNELYLQYPYNKSHRTLIIAVDN